MSYNSVEQDIDDPLLEQSLYQARGSMRCFVESLSIVQDDLCINGPS